MPRSSTYVVVVALFFSLNIASARAQDSDATPLHPGTTYDDSLSGSDVHHYTLALEADQFVRGEVDQQTVDVVVTIYAPDGTLLSKNDVNARGRDLIQFESDQSGSHRIEISPFEQGEGRYALTIQRVEPVATAPESRVDQLLSAFSGESTPGAVVAVTKDGELVFSRAYGMANLTHSIPFDTDMRTNIGSTSKQFTAFAVALLARRGELSLDDDVRAHISELPDFGETVTLRHLLTHTSGYREYLNTLALSGRRLHDGDFVDRKELIEIVQRQPELQNAPGSEWNYNNTGFGLATVVVERVTGQDFPEWMNKNVFEPLGMNDTFVRASQAQLIPNSAQGYLPAKDGEGYRNAEDLGAAMGAGGIYTTVNDLARWIDNLRTGRVGGTDLVEEMTTPYVLSNGDTTGYGLGLFVDEHRGLRRVQHGGADIAHRSMLAYYPEIRGGVVTLSNNASFSSAISSSVAEAFFEAHMTSKEDEGASSEIADAFDPASYKPESFDAYVGRYELDAAPGFILTFTRENDSFYTQATGQPQFEIFPTSDSTFKLTLVEASLTFHREPDGNVKTLTLHQNGNHIARRVEEIDDSAETDLEAFSGRFFSEELETYYTLTVEDSALVLRHRRLDDVTLNPTKEDVFSGRFPISEITFEREESGAVAAFSVSNGRTRGVRFVRVE